MTNLPNSEQSGDLDNINVTRAQFRAEIGVFLEFVAQALGGVTGNYTIQEISPTAPILQGEPTLEPGATPPDDSRDDRIPSTRWVQEHGRFVGSASPGTPADGMLWVDTSSNPYQLQVYNAGETDFDVLSGFPSGTRMLFQQETAPTGWTKVTSGIDNHALRVTTGSPGIVSSNQGFTTVFTSAPIAGNVGDTILTVDQMPVHSHGVTDEGHAHGITDPGHSHSYQRPGYKRSLNDPQATDVSEFEYSANTGSQQTGIQVDVDPSNVVIQNNGADSAHNHPFAGTNLDLSINYVDVIVAQKN